MEQSIWPVGFAVPSWRASWLPPVPAFLDNSPRAATFDDLPAVIAAAGAPFDADDERDGESHDISIAMRHRQRAVLSERDA